MLTLFFSKIDHQQIISIALKLFAVIDILGAIPILMRLRKVTGSRLNPIKITLTASTVMVVFVLAGVYILNIFHLKVSTFSLVGAFLLFIMGLEMVLGIQIFKADPEYSDSIIIVPIAFPLIAGPAALTTLIDLQASHALVNILIALLMNLLFVYFVLRHIDWIAQKIGQLGLHIIHKIMGIILLCMALQKVIDFFAQSV